MAVASFGTTGKSTAELARQLRRMKRRLFLELVNSNGSSVDDYTHRFLRSPSDSSMGSTGAPSLSPSRIGLSRSYSDASGLLFSSRSIDTEVAAGDENAEI
jgi:hypothetical protein